jgi:hypothetical protein
MAWRCSSSASIDAFPRQSSVLWQPESVAPQTAEQELSRARRPTLPFPQTGAIGRTRNIQPVVDTIAPRSSTHEVTGDCQATRCQCWRPAIHRLISTGNLLRYPNSRPRTHHPPGHDRRRLGPRWVRMAPGIPGSQRARAVTIGRTKLQVNAPSRRSPAPVDGLKGGFELPTRLPRALRPLALEAVVNEDGPPLRPSREGHHR